jgi:heme/copper-type cytochrome/quinol oxidase subunit 3
MPIWPALLLAPLVALGEQSIVYALSTPTCQTQREAWLHGVPIVALVLTLLFTAMAAIEWRRLAAAGTAGHPMHQRRFFLAQMAVGCGALSCLIVLALWLPQWVLSPCAA